MKCIFCDKQSTYIKYLGVPGYIMVPNSYATCEDHKDKFLRFEDVYNEDGTRKPIPV